jgi:hypothetical protein
MHSNSTSYASQAILGYLEAHPGAEDSLEGIAQWWIAEAQVELGKRTVRDALAQLVVEGKVSARRGSNGQILYRRQPTESGSGTV